MNKDETKSNLAWIVNILGFLILLGGIIFAAGQNREKINNNACEITRVDNASIARNDNTNAKVNKIYDLIYNQNADINKIIGKLETIDRRMR
jgi:hypothetical protein